MVKACKDWGIKHFSYIGHSLHLVVRLFLLVPKKQKDSRGGNNDAMINKNDESGELVDDGDDCDDLYDDLFDIEGAMVLEV